MKKSLIILLAIIVFFVPLMQIQQQTAHAAIVGKVISKSAKEIAKEIVADAAFETAGSMALKYAFDDKDGKFKIDPGTKLICLPGGKVGDDCTTPAQIDTDFTKSELKPEIDSQLEKHINNGKHFNKWERFLDWFAPLWAIAFGVTVLTYAIDSDVRTFFNEVAMDTLYALGILQPVDLTQTQPSERPDSSDVIEDYTPESATTSNFIYSNTSVTGEHSGTLSVLGLTPEMTKNSLLQVRISPVKWSTLRINGNYLLTDGFTVPVSVTTEPILVEQYDSNGQIIKTRTISPGQSTRIDTTSRSSMQNINLYMPYMQDGKLIFDYTALTQSSVPTPIANIKVTITSPLKDFTTVNSLNFNASMQSAYSSTSLKMRLFVNSPRIETVPLPIPEEIAPVLDPLKVTPYTDGAIVTMPSPVTIPYKHSETGEPLHRDETDPNVWRDPVGDPVPEDLIEVGEPEIIKQPDGSHVAVPQPTPSNPTPVPEQITQPLPDTITPEDFEGLSCDTIKKPKFDPLATAVMTSFPFSIPWDIQRIYEALFANVGSERPEFVFKIPGYDQEFPISLNSYFDDWVPFIRSIILLTFDMGLLYAAYRWTKGGSE